jgi:hypothetical protein
MSIALRLYEQITAATNDDGRFRAIADAIDSLEQAMPARDTLATRGDLREMELRLQKEQQAFELKLTKEVEQVRLDLTKELHQLRLETTKELEQIRVAIHSSEERTQTALHRQTIWIITALGAIVGLIRVLDYVFK